MFAHFRFHWLTLAWSSACIFALLAASDAQTIPAFPGAEGYGAHARGGRGGDVYYVTNLNTTGPGSLAEGLTKNVPANGRTIVFGVSGYAAIGRPLKITSSKITIAGQTAPGDGFGIRDSTFWVSGDDIVVRHLRFRYRKKDAGGDCIDLDSGSINTVFDHCSIQFSTDENFSTWSPPDNLTLQWSLNAWGLQSHSCGALLNAKKMTVHHTLWAHNHTRNPKARPEVLLDWVNNVNFDWNIGFIMGDSATPANWKANVRSCYFIAPAGNTRSTGLEKANLDRNGNPNFNLFMDDTVLDHNGNGILDVSKTGYSIASGTYRQSAAPFPQTATADTSRPGDPIVGVPVMRDNYLTAYKKVVSRSGALRLEADPAKPLRDEVDSILIDDLVMQRRRIISRESETGASASGMGVLSSTSAPVDSDRDGMPDFWEAVLGLNPGVQEHNGVLTSTQLANSFFPPGTPAGYTHLEEYLHFKAIPHAVVAKNTASDPSFVDFDLRKFTSGFNKSPVFTVANVNGGAAVQSGPGGALVRFTPPVNYSGRARFNFTVTDADGSSWTQSAAILVSAAGVPRDLLWQGDSASNVWNTSSNLWVNKGTATVFSIGDAALFNDLGSSSPAVNLTTAIIAGSVTVDAAKNYTFSGSGSLTGAMALTKAGAGTLTLSNSTANAYSGGTVINEGALVLGGSSSLGSGPATLAGGSLSLTTASGYTLANAINVTAPGVLQTTNNTFFTGPLSGGGDLNVSSSILTPEGSWAGYSGKLTISNNATIRFNQGSNPWGAAGAILDAGASGTIRNRATTIAPPIALGALSGGPGSWLRGSDQAGNVTDTYVIGGLNLSTTFAGTITNGTNATPHKTALTKVGSGTLTLTGSGSHTGATAVSGGTLQVDGAISASPVTVASGGQLEVNGAIGSTVTVHGGGALRGRGALNGSTVLQANSTVSPGAEPGTAGVLTAASGLAVAGAIFQFDLTSSPGGANDRISLPSGTLALSGANTFQINYLDGALGAGDYLLMDGAPGTTLTASAPTLNFAAPVGTRQTFALQRPSSGSSPAYVRLRVTGNAASLVWTGAGAGVWDLQNASAWSGGPTPTFFNLDAVTFTDATPNGAVNLAGSVAPRQITVTNNSTAYTFGGAGSIDGSGALIKSGAGTLTLNQSLLTLSSTTALNSTNVTLASTAGLAAGMAVSGSGIPAGTTIAAIINATTLTLSQPATAAATVNLSYFAQNTYSGGTVIHAGSTIVLANAAANISGLGSGPVTFNGGTLAMFNSTNFPPAGLSDVSTWDVIVPAGQSGRLNADSRSTIAGSLTGAGTFSFWAPWVRTDVVADWSAFTGRLNVITDAGGGDFRIAQNYWWPGLPQATVDLANGVSLYFSGIVSSGAGTIIEIGELSGGPLSQLRGGPTGGRNFTWRIGGKTPAGSEVTFSGTIAEQNIGSITHLVKTGAGTWRLSGSCNYNGSTSIEAGVLKISGSLSAGGAFQVGDGGTLELAGGTVTTDAVNVAQGAALTGAGQITGDLNNDGLVTCGNGGALVVTGDVVNEGTMRFTGGARLEAAGAFVNNGVLDLLTGAQTLPENFENNGVVIDSSSLSQLRAQRSGATVTLNIQSYRGHTYQLQRASSLTAPVWSNIGAPQPGTDGTLTFTDSAATGDQGFYRVQVTP